MSEIETLAPSNEPSPDVRLNAAENSPESLRRLTALKEVLAELSEDHSDIVGATIYGSTASGKARPDSDIDGYVYADISKSENPDIAEHIVATKEVFSVEVAFGEELGKAMSDDINSRILAKMGELSAIEKDGKDALSDLKVVPISEDIINQNIAELSDWAQAHNAREQYWRDLETSEEIPEEYNLPELPDSPSSLARQINGLFHPDVSGSLGDYRRQVVEGLKQLGAAGEYVWQGVADFIETFEGNREIEEMPRTLEEAARVYG